MRSPNFILLSFCNFFRAYSKKDFHLLCLGLFLISRVPPIPVDYFIDKTRDLHKKTSKRYFQKKSL